MVIARSGVNAGFVTYWDQKFFLTDAFSFQARGSVCNSRYLYFALQSVQQKLQSMKMGAGVPPMGESVSLRRR